MSCYFSLNGKRVWIAGHGGMVGSALGRHPKLGLATLVTAERSELDLRRQDEVERWLEQEKPDAIFLAAAKVGGILANDSRPGEFLYDNLVIETNIVEAARKNGVAKLIFLGSSCIYPKMAPQPINEEALLTGPLEPTNEWYAIAKIAGLKMAQAYRRQYGCDFISAMPTNLYGPGDNFDLASSHVVPAMLRKFHHAKMHNLDSVVIWGTGTVRREFLHVDDCADALIFLMENYSGDIHVNVGTGTDLTILELAQLVAKVIGYQGEICHDLSKPDGTPRKLMDGSRLKALGWTAKIGLEEGLAATYDWFRAHYDEHRP